MAGFRFTPKWPHWPARQVNKDGEGKCAGGLLIMALDKRAERPKPSLVLVWCLVSIWSPPLCGEPDARAEGPCEREASEHHQLANPAATRPTDQLPSASPQAEHRQQKQQKQQKQHKQHKHGHRTGHRPRPPIMFHFSHFIFQKFLWQFLSIVVITR